MLTPGSTIGILGGGQLGRMIALAAAELGIRVHIYAPEADSPAFEVASRHTVAAYEDEDALAAFAREVDVVTYEFENIPAASAEVIAALVRLHPGVKALSVTQDRLTEKDFITSLGIGTAPYRKVDDLSELESALQALGRPGVLKTRRFGYDGKGQAIIRPDEDAAAALASLRHAPAILEGFVPFTREVSVVAARSIDGSFVAYDLCENTHRHHILDVTHAPARLAADVARKAVEAARLIADSLEYAGVLAVEMFVVDDGAGDETVLVNEIAPRVHNSGHWTIEGAQTSQFAQHVRAISGWPLGAVGMTGAAATMTNLIGDDVDNWRSIAAEPGAHLHLYGKGAARPGRKMGHVTRIAPLA